MFARSIPLVALITIASAANAQLRVVTWNITNWGVTSLTNARVAAFQTSIYGVFSGRSMAPDVMMIQEVQSAASLETFRQLLNTAPGSPGDWQAYAWPTPISPQTSLPDTQSALLYRSSKIVPIGGVVTVAQGSSATDNQPRNTYRFDFYPVGYQSAPSTPYTAAILSAYVVHLKAGSASSDESRRLIEAQRIRLDANNLSPRGGIIVAGDFNLDSSSAGSYQELTGTQVNNSGRMFDPINSPGSWADNQLYKYIHTQDQWTSSSTTTNVGIDDRYDFVMMSSSLLDGEGMHYIGNPNLAYSTTTWNDPNHSYRCWGNDGSSWRLVSGSWQSRGITVTGNTMVGATIAQALLDSTGNQSGHLPVFADLRVPPVASVNTVNLDFGIVGQGTTATLPIEVNNNGNDALWGTNGIADLIYSFNTTGNFTGPAGSFTDREDDGPKQHNITVNTSNIGRVNGTVTITTNAPGQPTLTINCTAMVAGRITRPSRVPHP